MKKLFTVLGILFISVSLFAQANSVQLKDGGGTLISSHNTIQAAYNAIPGTITGAYLIEILSTYNNSEELFPVTFGLRTGSSISNTITIRPAAGNTGKVISTSISGTGGVPLFLFDGCEFVIFDGRPGGVGSVPDLKIENTSTAGTSYTIELTNAASNNVLRYLYTYNGSANTAGGRNIAVDATPVGANTNNLIANCEIDGGRSAIGLISTGTGAIPNNGTTFLNCVIKNFGYAGIWYLGASENTTVTGCTFYQETSSNSAIMSAISIAIAASGGVNTIEKCKIYNIQSTAASPNPKGITGGAAAGSTLRIINNFISLALNNNTAPTVYGIHLTGTADYTIDILYNSIYIGGNHSGGTAGNVLSAGIVKANTGAAVTYTQKNNIVINKRTGGTAGGFHTGGFMPSTGLVGTLDVDYNNYYATGDPGSFHAGWNSVLYNDIAQYKAAATPYEQNSKFHDVAFVSLTDLHLASASQGDIELAGIPIAGITDDIDNELRDPSLPYKGADEGTPLPVELAAFTSSVSGNNVLLSWSTATETNNSGFEIQRKTEESTLWESLSFVNGSGTSTEITNYSYADLNVTAGSYSYRLKQVDFNGTYTFYDLAETVTVGVPAEFSLAQNYPNPFNPSTRIKYSVPTEQVTEIKLYDVLGNEVMTLLNESKAPGYYEVEFNAASLPSGVYIYRMQSGSFTDSKKLMLLK
jgi:hypothetical protein